jgi:hypothetical protein
LLEDVVARAVVASPRFLEPPELECGVARIGGAVSSVSCPRMPSTTPAAPSSIMAAVEGNGIHATQVSNQDTAVLLHYPIYRPLSGIATCYSETMTKIWYFFPRIFECFPELCHLCQKYVQFRRIQAIPMAQHAISRS